MLSILVIVATGSGAVCRYLLDTAIKARTPSRFPWGTFVINVSGAFVLGLLTGLMQHHGLTSDSLTILGVGFCGGYTTWSTLVWESIALADTKAMRVAVLNLGASLAVGLLAAAAGLGLASL